MAMRGDAGGEIKCRGSGATKAANKMAFCCVMEGCAHEAE